MPEAGWLIGERTNSRTYDGRGLPVTNEAHLKSSGVVRSHADLRCLPSEWSVEAGRSLIGFRFGIRNRDVPVCLGYLLSPYKRKRAAPWCEATQREPL